MIDLLMGFAFAFVIGVLGVLVADLAHIADQLNSGVHFIHVGARDTADMIFKAGWYAAILFMLAWGLLIGLTIVWSKDEALNHPA